MLQKIRLIPEVSAEGGAYFKWGGVRPICPVKKREIIRTHEKETFLNSLDIFKLMKTGIYMGKMCHPKCLLEYVLVKGEAVCRGNINRERCVLSLDLEVLY